MMVPFESLDMGSYSHSIATMAVSLTVSTQYTNVTAPSQSPRRAAKAIRYDMIRYDIALLCI